MASVSEADTIHQQTINIETLKTRSVTLYPSSAAIVRDIEGVIIKPGRNEITILGLSVCADENTIKVGGHGTDALITDMVVEQVLRKSDDSKTGEFDFGNSQKLDKIKKEMDDLQQKIEDAEETAKSCINQVAYIEQHTFGLSAAATRTTNPADISAQAMIENIQKYSKFRAGVYQDYKMAQRSLKELKVAMDNKRLEEASVWGAYNILKQHALDEKRKQKSGFPQYMKQVTITIESGSLPENTKSVVSMISTRRPAKIEDEPPEESGGPTLSISYIVLGASWKPRYNLRLDTTSETGVLTYHAELLNCTGETWRDTTITLSTSQTSFKGLDDKVPWMDPWHLSLRRIFGTFGTGGDELYSQKEKEMKQEGRTAYNGALRPGFRVPASTQNPAASLFRSTFSAPNTSTSGLFSTASTSARQGASPFSNNPPSGSGLFGNSADTGASFSGNNPSRGCGLFGNSPPPAVDAFSNNTSTGASLFSNVTSARTSSSDNNANTGTSLFGNNPSRGCGLFGNNIPPAVDAFGNNANTGASLFGNSTNTGANSFGNNTNAGASLFGNSTDTGDSFSGNNPSRSCGLFGNNPPPAVDAFGNNTNTGASLFSNVTGAHASSSGNNTNTGGLFGNSTRSGSGLFSNKEPPRGGLFGDPPPRTQTRFGQAPAGDPYDSDASDSDATFDPPEKMGLALSSSHSYGLTTTYDLPGTRTIHSSRLSRRHVISETSLSNIEFSHIAVPKLCAAVFLKARIQNSSSTPLLRGPVGLTLDGSFLGNSTIGMCAPEETFELGLGIDEEVIVEYRKPVHKMGSRGVLVKEQVATYKRGIRLYNSRSKVAKLLLFDQVPISEDERLKISILNPRGLRNVGDVVKISGTVQESGASAKNNIKGGKNSGEVSVELRKGGEIRYQISLEKGKEAFLPLEYEARLPVYEAMYGLT